MRSLLATLLTLTLPAQLANAMTDDPLAVQAAIEPGSREWIALEAERSLKELVASAAIGEDGEVYLTRALSEPEFLEPESGYYWQIEAEGRDPFTSRSLWDRTLDADSDGKAGEPLVIAERRVMLPGSDLVWRFRVARRAG